MDLGKRFRRFREKTGLTQTEAAAKMSIKYYQLGNYETNRSEPSITLLKKMSQVYGVSVDQLIGNKKPETEENTADSSLDTAKLLEDLENIVSYVSKANMAER